MSSGRSEVIIRQIGAKPFGQKASDAGLSIVLRHVKRNRRCPAAHRRTGERLAGRSSSLRRARRPSSPAGPNSRTRSGARTRRGRRSPIPHGTCRLAGALPPSAHSLQPLTESSSIGLVSPTRYRESHHGSRRAWMVGGRPGRVDSRPLRPRWAADIVRERPLRDGAPSPSRGRRGRRISARRQAHCPAASRGACGDSRSRRRARRRSGAPEARSSGRARRRRRRR